jgi:hypothetical protein
MEAFHSLDKYFQYPVVFQESIAVIGTIKKPAVQVCVKGFYDYGKASKYGYKWRSRFLAGWISNTTKPTWKGIHGNSTFKQIQDALYEKDFSKVKINNQNKIKYIFGRGFCLLTPSFGEMLEISNKGKNLKVYLVHNTTDSKIIIDQNPNSFVELGPTSNKTFDYKIYKINYEVEDNTIHDGTICVDYRKLSESYGECNYRALKSFILTHYGCYPPWMEQYEEDKQCEVNALNRNLLPELFYKIWKTFDKINSGIEIDLFKLCQQPCYQVKVNLEVTWQVQNWKDDAWLQIYDNSKTVPFHKAVYRSDIFSLTVELGSALGLWLGKGFDLT